MCSSDLGCVSIYSPDDQKVADIMLTGTAGSLSCIWGVPASSTLGTWKVGSITLIDTLGNQGEYTRNDTFEVDTGLPPQSPVSVALLNPIGGERWNGLKKIKWDATGDSLTVDLFYSHDGGFTWTPIVEGLDDTGEYTWDTGLVSQVGNEFVVKVRVTDDVGYTDEDESGLFTIVLPLGEKAVIAGPTVARTSITFYYNSEVDGYLQIYNAVGRPIYKTRIYAVDGFYEWDLTNSNGAMLGNGTYNYGIVTDDGQILGIGRFRIERGLGLFN